MCDKCFCIIVYGDIPILIHSITLNLHFWKSKKNKKK